MTSVHRTEPLQVPADEEEEMLAPSVARLTRERERSIMLALLLLWKPPSDNCSVS